MKVLANQSKSEVTLFIDFLTLFFPHTCVACSEGLVKGEEILCSQCLIDLPRANYTERIDNPLAEKLAGRLPLQYATALLKFKKGGIAQKLLHQLKYKGNQEVGLQLGKILGKEIREAGWAVDIIVPVPLHKHRLRQRGYNQSAVFAQGLSEEMGVSFLENISIRKKFTETQTRKSKISRWENVENVFGIEQAEILKNKHVLLVDDVVTTGATLEACGTSIIQSGCSALSIACIADAQS